jgi:pimeloyl-ACP methyl ester carboxylesterase
VLAAPPLAGAAYQTVATDRDARAFPAPGRLVDVGGRLLHLACAGSGEPTVVMDAYIGVAYWMLVAPRVAALTRVCTYDRAGEGWSEGAPAPRTALHMARELHVLLRNGEEQGPYVLVGSGMGGYVVRVYAAAFPAEVAGMLLVDTVSEEQPLLNTQPLWLARTVQVAGVLGVVRLKGGWTRYAPLPAERWPLVTALRLRTQAFHTAYDTRAALEESAAQVRRARAGVPDVPLTVLTPGPPRFGPAAPAARRTEAEARWQYWAAAHAQIARTAPQGRQLIAEQTDAPFPLTHPDLVARTIQDLVQEVRSGPQVGVSDRTPRH